MPTSKRELGNYGEQLAARHLREQGYTILAMNWTCKHGELDIVAKQGDTLVFIEVRTRRAFNTESAFESVDPRKREKLVKLANAYLSMYEMEEATWRIDVVAVAMPRAGKPTIEHVEDALDW